MNGTLSLRALLSILVEVTCVGGLHGGVAPENVAIVVNGESEASKTIAAEYASLRGVPAGNIVTIHGLSNTETIPVDEFRERVLEPVFKMLTDARLMPQIAVIAYSAEIPTAIDVRSDIGERKLPKIFTPTASVNGLTFLHQAVLAKDIRYLDLNSNWYARRIVNAPRDEPWNSNDQQRYASVLMMLQLHQRAIRQRKDGEQPSEQETTQTAVRMQEAVDVLDELQQRHPHSSDLHYNRACLLAQADQPDAAIEALQAAVNSGWWDVQQTLRDDDLKILRERDDFKTLVEEMKSIDFDAQPAVGFRSTQGWLPNGMSTVDARAPRYLLSTVLACTTGRGTSVDEAVTSLRRAVAADGSRPPGTIYFEKNGDVRSTTREWAFRNAARQLEAMGVRAIVEDGILPREKNDVAGAVIGAADFDWAGSQSTILPGAIVEHLTSFGGAMSKDAGQTPLTEFLRNGAAGSSGTVTEPYAIQAKFPSPFLHVHYASGCTLVEAYYQSVTGPYQLLVVGDPLAQPWRRDFSLKSQGLVPDQPLSGDVVLKPKTESSDGIAPAEWELYVDGRRAASVPAKEPLRWDTRQHGDGEHVLTLIARGDDAVQSIARAVLTVNVRNVRQAADPSAAEAVESAHREIWRRFVDPHGIMLDFADLDGNVTYPTPEECREGKPNALGWWSPIENGAMFNGLYLDAAIRRWEHTRSEEDAAKARRLMEGLLTLNSISDVKGFVGRGVSTDGKSHYPMGSNDQTLPWLVGLWRYWQSELATPEEKTRIARHLVETVEEIVKLDWKMPAEPPFGVRGTFQGFHFDEAARMLFTMKLMAAITGDESWQEKYRRELDVRGGDKNMTKLEICEAGMKFFYAKTHNWTSCTAVSALRGLWELESDEPLKAAYARGLTESARLAAESLTLAEQYNPQDDSKFEMDWRASMLPLWKPQRNEQEAVKLAEQQLREFIKTSPRRLKETAFIREPTSAAWIVTLCPDATVVNEHRAAIENVLTRYDYSRLYYSTFFWVECAWWRLPPK
ncbi:MAG: hypothetical protein KF777_04930 [Planctomycetaceae bacterium]|nr:hypothetical protein [Planctomycetaceae bacterium]